MASHRESVMLSGLLKGMGREAECLVSALKVSLPGTNVSHYASCSIFSAPDDLPEGQYLVTFGGETTAVQKRDSYWVASQSYSQV
jgi:hypothetical protein